MPEILQNTGAKLWSMVDDHDELQSNVFDQLFGTGGKSDIRLIDEAIGKINDSLNGYYFKIINNKLCICKDTESGTTSLPVSITDDNGHAALKVDGTSITIDSNGIMRGATVDDVFSLTSENAIQNKVVKAKFDEIEEKVNTNETTIQSHTTALETLNGEGDGSVKKTVSDEIAKVIADAPESLDTLKEISDWISGHEDDASAMNSAIQTNKSDIASLQVNKVDKEIGKSLLADTDKAKYDDAASKAHAHDNKSVLDKFAESSEGNVTYNGNEIKAKTDSELSLSSENPVQNKIVTNELNKKVDSSDIDTELSDTSENPVQNKVIKEKLDALDKAIDDAIALRASLEAYGMVKVTDSTAVTDSTGLALPATEKNATIDGTLANQISQLNTDYSKLSNKVNDMSFGENFDPMYGGTAVCEVTTSLRFGPFGGILKVCVGISYSRQTVALFLVTSWYENTGLFSVTKLHEQYRGTKYDISIINDNNYLKISTGDDKFGYYCVGYC